MGIAKFDLKSLSELDGGRIKEAFEQALRRCEADCKDRPALKEPRKVSLNVVVTPVVGDDGELESCNVEFNVVDAQPRRRTKTYNMRAAEGGLWFNELSPEDVRQTALDGAGGPVALVKEG